MDCDHHVPEKHSLLSSFEQPLEVDALRPLDRKTKSSIPDQLCKRAQTSADSEYSRVVQSLFEAVMMEQNSRARVDIRERVLGLSHR